MVIHPNSPSGLNADPAKGAGSTKSSVRLPTSADAGVLPPEQPDLKLSSLALDESDFRPESEIADEQSAFQVARFAQSFILSDPRVLSVQANSRPESVLELLGGINLD